MRKSNVMTQGAEVDAPGARLFLYASSLLLQRHSDMQHDLQRAGQAVMELAAVLRAYEASHADAAKKS